MLRISVLAAITLKEALRKSHIQQNQALRLQRQDGQLLLKLNDLHLDDRIMLYAEKPLIIVHPALADELGNALIDIDDSEGGNELVLRRKNSISGKYLA